MLEVGQLSKNYVSFQKSAGLLGALKGIFRRESVVVSAVADLSFRIERGEFVGLLGPNGAGKTTTLKMLTGLITPTSGYARAFGSYDTSLRQSAYLRRIGMVMGQRSQLNADLPAEDSFRLAQAIYGISEQSYRARLAECLDLFGIHAKLNIPVRKLSLGERMKMELILAILHEPEILYLDEPTIGLDFHAAHQIREFLAKANAELGITVILTSHYTKDIEELCRRVILINHGRIVYDGPLAGVDARIQDQRTVSLTINSVANVSQLKSVIQREGWSLVDTSNDSEARDVRFIVSRSRIAESLGRILLNIDASAITDLKVSERGIDEIFAEIYRRPKL